LRIAVDARPLADTGSGIGRVLAELVREVVGLGDDWFLYSDRPLPPGIVPEGGIRTRAGGNRVPAAATLYAQLCFPRWVRQDRVDLYWSPRHHLPVASRKTVPEVLTVHDLLWRRFPETMTRGRLLAERLLMPASIRRADLVVAVSEFTKREVIEFFPEAADKLIVIPSAPGRLRQDPQKTSVGTGDSGGFFLFVGTAEPRKNLPRLIRAHRAYCRRAATPLPLVVVGASGWKDAELRRLRRETQSDARIRWLGRVDDEELWRLYRAARCLVLPSLYEGFGLPIVEALAVGTPVIASDRAAMPEVAGSAAIFVEPLSEDSIAHALDRIASDDTLHVTLAARALEESRRYSWEKSARTLVEAMYDLVGR